MVKKETTIPMLFDIIEESIANLEEYTKNVSFDDYTSKRMLRDACEKNLEKIGDACNEILKRRKREDFLIFSKQEEIFKDAYAFRNKLSHGYDDINNRIVFETIERDISILKASVILLKEKNDV